MTAVGRTSTGGRSPYLTPDEFEAHVKSLFGGGLFFTTAQTARIEGVGASTVDNASYRGEIASRGTGKLKRFALWDIYRWHVLRRKPKVARSAARRTIVRRPRARATERRVEVADRAAVGSKSPTPEARTPDVATPDVATPEWVVPEAWALAAERLAPVFTAK